MNRGMLAILVAVAVALAVSWLSTQTDERDTVDMTLWSGGTTIVEEDFGVLPRPVRRVYDQWREGVRYFGAFASSPGGANGRTDSYNDQAMADAQALHYCGEQDCVVISRARPDLAPPDARAIPVETMQSLTDLKADTGRKAMAIHPNGAWGSYHGDRSLAYVREQALKLCRDWALEGNDLAPENERPEDCEVIYAAPQ